MQVDQGLEGGLETTHTCAKQFHPVPWPNSQLSTPFHLPYPINPHPPLFVQPPPCPPPAAFQPLHWTCLLQPASITPIACMGRLRPSHWCICCLHCCKVLYGAFMTATTSGTWILLVLPLIRSEPQILDVAVNISTRTKSKDYIKKTPKHMMGADWLGMRLLILQ